jgi:hypothetical protein
LSVVKRAPRTQYDNNALMSRQQPSSAVSACRPSSTTYRASSRPQRAAAERRLIESCCRTIQRSITRRESIFGRRQCAGLPHGTHCMDGWDILRLTESGGLSPLQLPWWPVNSAPVLEYLDDAEWHYRNAIQACGVCCVLVAWSCCVHKTKHGSTNTHTHIGKDFNKCVVMVIDYH